MPPGRERIKGERKQDLSLLFRPFVPQADPAYNDLQRQVQLLETLPAAPIRPTRSVFCHFHLLIEKTPRKTHLLTLDREMGVKSNGFNYWFYNNMLGPCRD